MTRRTDAISLYYVVNVSLVADTRICEAIG